MNAKYKSKLKLKYKMFLVVLIATLASTACASYVKNDNLFKEISEEYVDTINSDNCQIWSYQRSSNNLDILIIGNFKEKLNFFSGSGLFHFVTDKKYKVIDMQFIGLDLLKENYLSNLFTYGKEIADYIARY